MKYLASILACSTFLVANAKKVEKPNVVFVFADQWRAESMGYALK